MSKLQFTSYVPKKYIEFYKIGMVMEFITHWSTDYYIPFEVIKISKVRGAINEIYNIKFREVKDG